MAEAISYRELVRRIEDGETPLAELRAYFEEDPRRSRPFAPVYRLRPDRVAMDPAAAGGILFDVGTELANRITRRNRRRAYERAISDEPNAPRLISDGDSWFLHPFLVDVVNQLTRSRIIFSVDGAGDELQQIVRGAEIVKELDRIKPSAALVSGGGNDLQADGLDRVVTAGSRQRGDASRHIDPGALRREIDAVLSLFGRYLDQIHAQRPNLPTFIHGYDYAIPQPGGRWLGTPLARLAPSEDHAGIIRVIVDEFNVALDEFAAKRGERVVYVNCRSSVDAQEWDDELHPTDDGYAAVAKRFEDALAKRIPTPDVGFDTHFAAPGRAARIPAAPEVAEPGLAAGPGLGSSPSTPPGTRSPAANGAVATAPASPRQDPLDEGYGVIEGSYLVTFADDVDDNTVARTLERLAGRRAVGAQELWARRTGATAAPASDAAEPPAVIEGLGVGVVRLSPYEASAAALSTSALSSGPRFTVEPNHRTRHATPPVAAGATDGADWRQAYAKGFADGTAALGAKLQYAPPTALREAPPPSVGRVFEDDATLTWGLKAIGADAATATGAGVTVAVLDTGLDFLHPDFSRQQLIVGEAHFLGGPDAVDRFGHGTHCAGSLAGPLRPRAGRRYGVAPDVRLLIGKASATTALDPPMRSSPGSTGPWAAARISSRSRSAIGATSAPR